MLAWDAEVCPWAELAPHVHCGAAMKDPAAAFAEPASRPSRKAAGKRRRDTKAGRREQKRRYTGGAATEMDADNLSGARLAVSGKGQLRAAVAAALAKVGCLMPPLQNKWRNILDILVALNSGIVWPDESSILLGGASL